MVSVLVCDDQELVRDALRVVLSEDDQIEVREAASGVSDAVSALDADGVDVAVIDVRLTEESGLSLADWIRDHRPSTKIILISVRVTDELLVEAATLGVAAVVDKSVGVVELSRIVREVSAGRNLLTRDVVRAAQSIGAAQDPPVSVVTLDDLAGSGICAELVGWIEDHAT